MKIRLEVRRQRGRDLRFETEVIDYLIPSAVWAILKREFINPNEPWERLMKSNQLVVHEKEGVVRIFELLNHSRIKSLKY